MLSGEDSRTVATTRSALSTQKSIPLHKPIQLAAISNYKLAQLTFAPPDLHSLRKTAIIKNVLETIYKETPPQWLDQLTRWTFVFIDEFRSLQDMTQDGLEEMFSDYLRIMEAFKPNQQQQEEYDEEEDEDLWNDEDQKKSFGITESSIFSHPGASLSDESLNRPQRPSLDDRASLEIPEDKKSRRQSVTPVNRNRLSWTSDTGITSSVVAQHLANEIMNLFDMEFSVDIHVNTAPKLPELPFHNHASRRKSKRMSTDSFMALIPTFEAFTVDEKTYPRTRPRNMSNPIISENTPPPRRRSSSLPLTPDPKPKQSPVLPQRSSSLKYRQNTPAKKSSTSLKVDPYIQPIAKSQSSPSSSSSLDVNNRERQFKSSEFLAGRTHVLGDESSDPSRQPLRRLASLVHYEHGYNNNSNTSTSSLHPSLCSTSSFSSSEAGSLTRAVPMTLHEKSSNSERLVKQRSHQLIRPSIVDAKEIRRSQSLGRYNSKKNKQPSLMERTSSKQGNGVPPAFYKHDKKQPDLSRSRSAFIKIGKGLRTRRTHKEDTNGFSEASMAHGESLKENMPHGNRFVQRMATLGKRMRLQRA
ncbi:hypothetical protein J3Q64DRAFT_1748464 [Phycomyces blakesleeanus]|uniref:DNA replication regulator Sld3 C-terminal domain-containing protein n=1 Tax=Phycomyces blakesleeanus TaxID=4837 RepID=A0ABR3AWD8_PHYBL